MFCVSGKMAQCPNLCIFLGSGQQPGHLVRDLEGEELEGGVMKA